MRSLDPAAHPGVPPPAGLPGGLDEAITRVLISAGLVRADSDVVVGLAGLGAAWEGADSVDPVGAGLVLAFPLCAWAAVHPAAAWAGGSAALTVALILGAFATGTARPFPVALDGDRWWCILLAPVGLGLSQGEL